MILTDQLTLDPFWLYQHLQTEVFAETREM